MFGQSGDLSKDLRSNPSPVVSDASEVNRVKKKGRKRGVVSDLAWKDALTESMEGMRIDAPESVEDRAESVKEVYRDESPDSGLRENTHTEGRKVEFDAMMKEIRKMAEDPEKLLESHLGVFTEPAPPGKILDSQG
ncbi:MAG: hypothetical protein LBQ58_04770 [Synergistaceae bacterium]|nr:hypothetical protein [Synergistaceae bacterium]